MCVDHRISYWVYHRLRGFQADPADMLFGFIICKNTFPVCPLRIGINIILITPYEIASLIFAGSEPETPWKTKLQVFREYGIFVGYIPGNCEEFWVPISHFRVYKPHERCQKKRQW